MTGYDAAMIGVVLLGMIWGAWRGLTWQLAGLASLVGGYLVARTASAGLADQLPGTPLVARALAMLILYLLTSGFIFFIAWTIRATLKKLKFEAYDRHLGMVFGGLEGAILGLVATLFITSLAPSTRAPIFASPVGQVVGNVMAAVGPALPVEARRVLAPFWDDVPASGVPSALVESDSGRHTNPLDNVQSPDEPRDGLGLGLEPPPLDPLRPGSNPGQFEWFPTPAPSESRADAARPSYISPYRDEIEGLGKSAGEAVGRSLDEGTTDPLKGLADEGRARLGRALGNALRDVVDRASHTDDDAPAARPR